MRRCQLMILLLLLPFYGCAPIFSEFQSAKTVGEEKAEITPGISPVFISHDSGSELAQTTFGVQAAYGIAPRADIRMRLEAITIGKRFDGLGDYFAWGFGPKIALLPEHIAFYLPVGFGFGKGLNTSDTFETQPTLLLTHTFSDELEINVSGKYIVQFDTSRENLWAFNLGLGLLGGPAIFRPEAGILLNPGEENYFFHVGAGWTIGLN